ncbi:MAG: RHS repeat-associated core domain-containing protein [Thermoguttaceae bacterium]
MLDTGYTVDPTVPFTTTITGNYYLVVPDSSTTYDSWEEGGVSYTATIVENATLTTSATLGEGTWTYYESLVSTYTVTTSGSDGSTAHESGGYDYTFSASGTTDASGAVDYSAYTFSASGSSSASGSVTQTWSSGGWSDTTSYEWHYSTSFDDAVSNATDIAAGSGSGSSSGSGAATFIWSASGSYLYSFDGGSTSGTLSASGSEGTSYQYATLASCSGGAWTETGSASIHETGTSDYEHGGGGSHSGSGLSSGSGSGGGQPWSFSGSFDENARQESSSNATTNFSLAASGDWEPTTASGSGSASSSWSYSGGGAYSHGYGDEAMSGSYSDSGLNAHSYQYSVTSVYTVGDWTDTGTASYTLRAEQDFGYSGSGDSSASGGGSMSGSGSSWGLACTVDEDGSDHSRDQTITYFEINDDGQWEPTTASGSGSASSSWSYSASGSYWYSLDEGTASGTFTDSATNGVAYGYSTTGVYTPGSSSGGGSASGSGSGAANSGWTDTGSGWITMFGNSHYDYSDTVDLAIVADGWNFDGTLLESANHDASYSYTNNLSLAEGAGWEATGGSGSSSGMGSADWSYQGEGEYWYDVVGGGTVSGGFSATNVDHMIYTFDTSATYADGVWSETGSATVTDLLNSDSDYSADSTVSSSGVDWSASVTVVEGGHDSYMHLATIGYALDAEGNWQMSTASVGAGGHGSSDWDCQADGDYWYLVGQTTVTGTFTDEADDHMTYSYSTTSTAVDGVWTYGGGGQWTDRGGGGTTFSLRSPYTTADGIEGTVTETGSQSYAYNYSGTPSLGEEGDWAWSGGSGISSGVGEATWKKQGTAPYSRTDNATYSVSGTRGESVEQKLSYSYTILASISDGAWALSGTGDNEAKGTAGTSYSGSGSFSSSGFSSFSSENGGASESFKATLDFTLKEAGWVATNGSASTSQGSWRNRTFDTTETQSNSGSWGVSGSGSGESWSGTSKTDRHTMSTFRHTYREDYLWNPGQGSDSGSGSGGGSASGSGGPWELTETTDSASATLDRTVSYTYSGSGHSWYVDAEGPSTGSSDSRWNTANHFSQSSHSEFQRTLTGAPGEEGDWQTSGTETHAVSASGSASSAYHSQWAEKWTYTGANSGWTEENGGTYDRSSSDQYDYQCSNAITYNADGSVSYSPDQANNVSGSYSDRGTGYWKRSDWWSPSSGSGSGGGSGGGSSSSSSSSGDGGSSYSETVSYPGFFDGAYYGGGPAGAGGGLIEYIGDIFIDGSGAGYVGMTMAMEGEGGSAALDLEAAASDEAGAAVAAEEVSDLSGQDSVLPWRAAPDSAPQFSGDAFATGSPMWGRQAGLGLFAPQRNGPTIVIDVDRAGNIRAITDALGNRAAYGYDLAGNVTSVTDPNGDATHFSYDSAGRLTAVVDALFNETDFSYDEDGRVTEETIVLEGQTLARSYDRDAAGHVVRKVDRNGRVTVFVYDPSGRMTHEVWYTSAADADGDVNRLNTITWTYDEAGNLTSVADNSSCYVYSYDAQGRVLSETVMPIGGPVTVLTIGYGTREDALPVSLSATVDGAADFLTSFEYDCQGRVVAIRQTGQGAREVADKHVTFAYADTGALERIVRYESLDTSQMVAVSEFEYDVYGRLVSLVHHQNADNPLAEYTWTYEGGGLAEVNSAGNQDNPLAGFGFSLDSLLASATEARVNPLPDHVWTFDAAFTGLMTQMTSPDGVAEYSYDTRGQLTGASYDYQPGESYSYDANGNRTTPGYVTGAYNRLLSDGTYNYEYDAEGNRIKRTNMATGEATEYVWDHRNRLVAVIDRASDGGPILQSVEYAYDSQNRWIAKSLDADGDGPEEATSTYFVYDGNQIILQIDAEGQVTNRYLWGPAVDQILADEQVQFDGSSVILWALTDHLNTVRDLAVYAPECDATTIVNHTVYDAFGRVTSQTDPAVATLFGFTARPFDRDTGLQNNLNRWYDAETGTWISEDPKGFAAADANLYRYVGNLPNTFLDPTGKGLLSDAVAEAIKTLLSTQGGETDTMNRVTEREAVNAVIDMIKKDLARKVWPKDVLKQGQRIKVTDATTPKGARVQTPRIIAGRLGYDVTKFDEKARTLQEASDDGKLTVTDPQTGKKIALTLVSVKHEGEIVYTVRYKGETPYIILWTYRFNMVVTVKAPNGRTFEIRHTLFRQGGFWRQPGM